MQACKAAFSEIMKYQNEVAQEKMVQRLIDGIQVHNNMTIMLAKTKVKEDKLRTWIGAVSYMATKVTEDFGFAKGNKNQGRGGNRRRISEVEGRGRGRDGRGRGLSRGRGQGFRRSNGPFFNGVD